MSNRDSLVMPPPRPAGRSQANESFSNSVKSRHVADRDRAESGPGGRSNSNPSTNNQERSLHGRGTSQFRFTQLPTPSSIARSPSQGRQTTDRDPSFRESAQPVVPRTQSSIPGTHLAPPTLIEKSSLPHNAQTSRPEDSISGIDDGLLMQRTHHRSDASTTQSSLRNKTSSSSFTRGDGSEGKVANQISTQAGLHPSGNFGGRPSQNSVKQGNVKSHGSSDLKRDLKVVTTSLESCMRFHKKTEYHPALLIFKTYGVLSSGPETPESDTSSRSDHRGFVVFELFERRSDSYLSCYFLETERRLPAVCMGRTYTVVGQFLKEEGIGDFKVLAISEATPDNGIRQNLFNFNDQLLRKLSLA